MENKNIIPEMAAQQPSNTVAAQMQLAEFLKTSDILPAEYKGKPANIFILIELAKSTNKGIIECANRFQVIMGKLSPKSEAIICDINRSGLYEGVLKYESTKMNVNGKEYDAMRAYAKEKASGQILYGSWVSMLMAEQEGWLAKPGSKWRTMPEQMLKYRAATFFARLYGHADCFMSQEEAEDVIGEEQAPANSSPLEIAQPEVQPAAQPALQAATKPAERPVTRTNPAAQPAAQPALQAATKPAERPVTRTNPAAQPAAQPAAKSAQWQAAPRQQAFNFPPKVEM